MKRTPDHSPAPPPRKLKFAPKAPPQKITKPAEPKITGEERKDATIDKELLAKLRTAKNNDSFGRRMHKNDGKAMPTQVAFGQVNSLTARSFPIPRSHPTGSDASTSKAEKEHVVPWDYIGSNYPITLPLRRPYSGNPEILDKEEFGEASVNLDLDETRSNAAGELGLMEESEEPRNMFFFQLPTMLPIPMKPATAVDTKDTVRKTGARGCKLTELPGGFMGKLLVYKSGKVKMKLGETLFDVLAGTDCVFAQDIAAINTEEKHCCILGEVGQRAVVTPDIDSILDSVESMESL